MPKLLKYKSLPLNIKIAFALFLLGLFSLTFLFLLLIPKMHEEEYKTALKSTEKKVLLIKQQIKLVVDYFNEYSSFKKEEAKKDIINTIEKTKLKYSIDETYNEEQFIKDISKIKERFNCSINIMKKNNTLLSSQKNITFDFDKIEKNNWVHFQTFDNLCPHPSNFLYKTNIQNYNLELNCSSYFRPDPKKIERRVKKIIQEGFSLTEAIHKGKVYLMWINKNPKKNELNTPISSLENQNNQNYCLSKISNMRKPNSGELTLEQLLKINETKLIYHKIEDKKSISFVSQIYEDKNKKFLFVLSAFEEDFKNNIHSPIIKILPLSIFALLASIIFGIVIFKKWIKNISKLSNTAKIVNTGDLTIRSNVKGNDELGLLGITFDLMLDNLQDNIKNLDKKIDERTKELTENIKTKEILLKELNHRVKNNLFMIINFIKLQKSKTRNEDVINGLSTIENRIYTTSLIHSKLFESKTFEYIDANTYINDLIDEISESLVNTNKIIIKKDIQKINLEIDTAMNCGLILNELLTNSFKYAFKEKKENKIDITFVKHEKEYKLIFQDNGKGLEEDFDIKKCESLGMKLISSITKYQLKGSFKIENKNGVKVTILFPINF